MTGRLGRLARRIVRAYDLGARERSTPAKGAIEVSEVGTLGGHLKTQTLLLHLALASASTIGDYTVHRLSRAHLEALGYDAGNGKRGAPVPVRRQGSGRDVIDLPARRERTEFYTNEEETTS